MKKPKKKTCRQLKKEADKIFSLWIRMRNSKDFMNSCYTCGKVYYIKDLQCGHFVSRIYSATRWDERNCQPQCPNCNVWRRGQHSFFAEHLLKDYGPTIITELNAQSKILVKLNRAYLEQIIYKYT